MIQKRLAQMAELVAGVAVACAIGLATASAATSRSVYGHPDAHGNPVTMDGFKLESSGTGFYVSMEGDFVTPFHVAGSCDRLAVLRSDGPYAARTVAMDADDDVAVVRTAPPKFAAALTAGTGLPQNASLNIERTWDLGGLASRSSLGARYLRAISDYPPADFEVRAGAPVIGGNSGSPVVSAHGAVAGMVRAIERAQPTVTLVIGSRRIAEVLQRAGVSFNWLSNGEGPLLAPGAASRFTFPILCYAGLPRAMPRIGHGPRAD